jgi:hypothetical protein
MYFVEISDYDNKTIIILGLFDLENVETIYNNYRNILNKCNIIYSWNTRNIDGHTGRIKKINNILVECHKKLSEILGP